MRLLRMIRLDSFEMETLERAFQPWRLVTDDNDSPLAKTVRHVESNNPQFSEVKVLEMEENLRRMIPAIEKDLHAEASPDWVVSTQKALEEGRVPLILNPQMAVAVIRETRRTQLEAVKKGLELIKEIKAHLALIPVEDVTTESFWEDPEDERSS